jgi:AcrR family transcriptional regulator
VPDGRLIRGDRTRARVLAPGVELATVKGLEAFSLGELAAASGVSKAGIVTLFGPKHDLQMAIAIRAREILHERVFAPTLAAPAGLAQLSTLGEVWLDYLTDPHLRGGCFFAAALFELDAQPGPLRDAVRHDMRRWLAAIQAMISHAQANGEVARSVNAEDEAFALFSLGITANAMIQLGVVERPAHGPRRVWRAHVERLASTTRSPT